MMKPLSRITLVALRLLLLTSIAYGQITTPRPSTTLSTTSSAAAKTHTILVGKGDHTFKPDITEAGVGDTIEFHFFPANHSVVRAEYDYPCIPIEALSPTKANTSFFSGFHPVSAILDDPPAFQVTVKDTKPIYFYCSAPDACIKYGMVGVVNPAKGADLAQQRNLAKKAAYMLQPGEAFPAEGTPTVSPSPSSSASVSPGSGGGKRLSAGAIAGIVIAGLFVLVIGALLFFYLGRTRTLRWEAERKDSTITQRTRATPATTSHFNSPITGAVYERMPPAYFNTAGADAGDVKMSASHIYQGGGVSRSDSRRSTGGTFNLSPTGVYQRTHEGGGSDTYKMAAASPHPSQYESPLLGRWGQVHFGPQARGQRDGMNISPHISPRGGGGAAQSYFEYRQTAPVEADGREIPRMF